MTRVFLTLRRVVGPSMMPSLHPGRLIVAVRTTQLHKGSIIVFKHLGKDYVKRIAKVDGERLYVLGDNPSASTDSRAFGWIERRQVFGRVIWPLKTRVRTKTDPLSLFEPKG